MIQPRYSQDRVRFKVAADKPPGRKKRNLKFFIYVLCIAALLILALRYAGFGDKALESRRWRKIVSPAADALANKLKSDAPVADSCPERGVRNGLAIWDLDQDRLYLPYRGKQEDLKYIFFIQREQNVAALSGAGRPTLQETAHLYLMNAQTLDLEAEGQVPGPLPANEETTAINAGTVPGSSDKASEAASKALPVPSPSIDEWIKKCKEKISIDAELQRRMNEETQEQLRQWRDKKVQECVDRCNCSPCREKCRNQIVIRP